MMKRHKRAVFTVSAWAMAIALLQAAAWSTTASAEILELVSVATDGTQPNAGSQSMVVNGGISADANFVLVWSDANNLDPTVTDTPGPDLFLRDRANGTTVAITTDPTHTFTIPVNNVNGAIFAPDNSYVLFVTDSTGYTSQDDTNNADDIFLYKIATGELILVTRNVAGTAAANAGSTQRPFVTPDSKYFIFAHDASDLVSTDTNNARDFFLYDVENDTISLISKNSAGTDSANGSVDSDSSPFPPSRVSPDGDLFVFRSNASDMTSDTDSNGGNDLFMYRISDGSMTLLTKSATAVSEAANGTNVDFSYGFSKNGTYVLYASDASDLTTDTDANSALDVFMYDVANETTTLVSKTAAGASGDFSSNSANMNFSETSIAFQSFATDLTADTDNTAGGADVFLYDIATGTIALVSKSINGGTANGASSLAGVGSFFDRYFVFLSEGTDLIDGISDMNFSPDIYLYDSETQSVTLVSKNATMPQTNNGTVQAAYLSETNDTVLWYTTGTDVVEGASVNRYLVYDIAYDRSTYIDQRCDGTLPNALSQPTSPGTSVIDGNLFSLAFFGVSSGATDVLPGVEPQGEALFAYISGTLCQACGDGIGQGDEQCDDGNVVDGDGCSSMCVIEDGAACVSANPSYCVDGSVCGDTVLSCNETIQSFEFRDGRIRPSSRRRRWRAVHEHDHVRRPRCRGPMGNDGDGGSGTEFTYDGVRGPGQSRRAGVLLPRCDICLVGTLGSDDDSYRDRCVDGARHAGSVAESMYVRRTGLRGIERDVARILRHGGAGADEHRFGSVAVCRSHIRRRSVRRRRRDERDMQHRLHGSGLR
ncbi:MAG: DUF4215 domain-containing protein [Polyangiales bacterium]